MTPFLGFLRHVLARGLSHLGDLPPPNHTYALWLTRVYCRIDRLRAKALFASMAKHPAIQNCDPQAGTGGAHLKNPREMSLLMVGAHLKHIQFEYLCKQGVFPGVNSSRDVTSGF